jgi:hypothetical protein
MVITKLMKNNMIHGFLPLCSEINHYSTGVPRLCASMLFFNSFFTKRDRTGWAIKSCQVITKTRKLKSPMIGLVPKLFDRRISIWHKICLEWDLRPHY